MKNPARFVSSEKGGGAVAVISFNLAFRESIGPVRIGGRESRPGRRPELLPPSAPGGLLRFSRVYSPPWMQGPNDPAFFSIALRRRGKSGVSVWKTG